MVEKGEFLLLLGFSLLVIRYWLFVIRVVTLGYTIYLSQKLPHE